MERSGRRDEALGLLNSTIAAATRNGEIFWLAELYRARARLLRATGARDEDVAADLRRALDVAVGQEAGILAVRARAVMERLGLSSYNPDS